MREVVGKPNIQKYHDYLEFLKDWVEFLKEREKGFSLRRIAKEAGMASGYLPMCFSRKRKLSEKFYLKIKPLLKLSQKEERYLDLLRVIAESDDPKQRTQALTNLQKLKDYKETHHSELEVHQYLSRWYYVAIRELVNTADFKPDYAWIQQRLRAKVSQKEVEEALQFLVRFEFVKVDGAGKYTVAEKQLDCHEGVYKISLGEFHRQMLDLAKIAIDETPREERLLLGHTVALTKQQFEKVKAILKETLNEVEKVQSEKQQGESEVFHIELTAIPLTEAGE